MKKRVFPGISGAENAGSVIGAAGTAKLAAGAGGRAERPWSETGKAWAGYTMSRPAAGVIR
ncbi:MAG TPA: hypothetical protein VE035_13175 [Puia sp.]|nr:hypothetical protein [Puia sp.]